jgi:hypothetical protein
MTKRRDLLAGVRVVDVLRHFDVKIGRRDERIAYVRWCPRCGPRASIAVAVHLDCGRWFDEARGCRGDLAEIVRGYADIPAGDEALALIVDAVRASAAKRAGAEVAS